MREWFLDAIRRVPEERAECIIRVQCHRRLATGPAPRNWWEVMQKARAAGRITVDRPRQPYRPRQPVPRRVVSRRVTCQGARRPGGRLPPVEVVAVCAKECRPPSGEVPIAWL
jgi:hypothetical protein